MKRPWKTQTIGAAMRQAIERQGLERGIAEQRLIHQWPELVGPAIATHATPQRLRGGVLWLQVEDAAWRQELSLMRRELIAKINAWAGEEMVKELRLR
ncbi:MAG: DUF721 domain-containing protein [Bacteroidetes bacterium]|nr:DUF721 domain-containing protein [Bacteroidota bacterium]